MQVGYACLKLPEQRWRVDLDRLEGVEGEGATPVIDGGNENTSELEQFVAAKFHFVDLAGSERVNKTGNKGERFKGNNYFISCMCCGSKNFRNAMKPCLIKIPLKEFDVALMRTIFIAPTE